MITKGDLAVINSILSPLDPNLDVVSLVHPPAEDVEQEMERNDPQLEESKKLEVKGVRLAEEGKLTESIRMFTEAITLVPERASGYNNRAQAHRLCGHMDLALEDLDRAVYLSGGQGRAGVNALCQRALIHLVQGREQQGMADLEKGSKQGGSMWATQLLVKMNPYSALCNQMLKQMITSLNQ